MILAGILIALCSGALLAVVVDPKFRSYVAGRHQLIGSALLRQAIRSAGRIENLPYVVLAALSVVSVVARLVLILR